VVVRSCAGREAIRCVWQPETGAQRPRTRRVGAVSSGDGWCQGRERVGWFAGSHEHSVEPGRSRALHAVCEVAARAQLQQVNAVRHPERREALVAQHHVCVVAGESRVGFVSHTHEDRQLPLRRARRDRRATNRELLPAHVHVVEALAVDEPGACRVANFGTRLPAVPERAYRLDVLGSVGMHIARDRPGDQSARNGSRHDRGQPARPATAHLIHGGEGRRHVERLGDRCRRGRNHADPRRLCSEPRCHQHRVCRTGFDGDEIDPGRLSGPHMRLPACRVRSRGLVDECDGE
jgi:hypothetical protein